MWVGHGLHELRAGGDIRAGRRRRHHRLCVLMFTVSMARKGHPAMVHHPPVQGSTGDRHTRIRARQPVPPRLLAARTGAGVASWEEGVVPSAGTAAVAGEEAGTTTCIACRSTASSDLIRGSSVPSERKMLETHTNGVGVCHLVVMVLERVEVLLDMHHQTLLGQLCAEERVRRALRSRRLRALHLRRRRRRRGAVQVWRSALREPGQRSSTDPYT